MTAFCLVELDGAAVDGGAAGVADASLRAITLARGLTASGGLAAVVFGDPPVSDLAAYGVTDVYAVSGLDGYAPLAWARVLQWLMSGPPNPGLHESPDESSHPSPQHSGHAVVAAGTERGNEVLAHLGAITGLPMAANCTGAVDNGRGEYAIVRQRWAGLLLEEAVLEAPTALLTVATDAVSAVPDEARAATATVHDVAPSVDGSDLMVRAVETPAGAGGASLASARVVVEIGRAHV